MMIKYTVESDKRRVIAGLGSFKPGEPQTFGPEVAESFRTISGMPLLQASMPKGVELTIEVVKEEN